MNNKQTNATVNALVDSMRDVSNLRNAWDGLSPEVQENIYQYMTEILSHADKVELDNSKTCTDETLSCAMNVALYGSNAEYVHGRLAQTSAACRILAREVQRLRWQQNSIESEELANKITKYIFESPNQTQEEVLFLTLTGIGGKELGRWSDCSLRNAIAMLIRELLVPNEIKKTPVGSI